MAENKVSVEITIEQQAAMRALGILGKEINKIEGEFGGLGKAGDNSFSVIGQAASGASSGFKSLVGGVTIANLASSAIIGTANAVKGFVVDSINAAAESEQATNRLGQSLRSVGAYSEQTVADFLDYASALSQVTTYQDDVIVGQLGLAKSFGASNQQAKDLVKAAAELAATFGGSLESRVQQLGKTLQGTGGKLDTLIPGFKALTEAQLKAGDAIDFINNKFGGAAANEIETYAGKIAQAKKAFGELQESLGGFVVNSGVADVFTSVAFALNSFNQSLSDSKIALARQAGGFTETTSSLDQLKRQYEELQVKAIDLEQTIINPANGKLADQTAIFIAKKQLAELNQEIAKTKSQIDAISPKVKAGVDNAPQGSVATEAGGISKEDQARINSRNAAYDQLTISQVEFAAWEEEQRIAQTEITAANYADELAQLQAFEQAKIDAKFAAEETKAGLITDSTTKKLALEKISADKELAIEKSKVETKKKIDAQLLSLEQQKQAALAGAALAGLNLLGSIAKDGSREQFLIQKAAAIGSAAIAAKVAYMQALAFPPGPPATIPTASWVAAAGVANVAAIVATSLKGFEYGGIVGGTSTTGDKIGIRVNSGEAILTRQDQTTLYNGIKSGQIFGEGGSDQIERLISAINSQAINLTVDGRVLATVIRNQVQSGFKIA